MDDEPLECPNCGVFALVPIRAAEVPGPLMYACGECMESMSPPEYAAWALAAMQVEEPVHKSLLDRIIGVLR